MQDSEALFAVYREMVFYKWVRDSTCRPLPNSLDWPILDVVVSHFSNVYVLYPSYLEALSFRSLAYMSEWSAEVPVACTTLIYAHLRLVLSTADSGYYVYAVNPHRLTFLYSVPIQCANNQ